MLAFSFIILTKERDKQTIVGNKYEKGSNINFKNSIRQNIKHLVGINTHITLHPHKTYYLYKRQSRFQI